MHAQPPARSVSFCTFGCKLNQYETNDLERQFAEAGWRTVGFGEPADVAVVNTCTVTARSDSRCRAALRRARRASPAGTVVAVGCYAQAQAAALAALPEVDLVLGNREKASVFAHLDTAGRARPPRVAAAPLAAQGRPSFVPIRAFAAHTRAFVKIQDGCDNRCSYCIVPLARGPNRSLREAEVLAQAAAVAGAGHREIVLTGVHLGSWGRDLAPARTLASLLRRLVALPGLARLRLSSIEPTEFTEELLAVLAGEPKICPHVHLPLQSGSERVLRDMGRPCAPGRFSALVERLAAILPEPGIGADVIAGFPGEDETAFRETAALLSALPVTYLHVFPYSPRPGTPAAAFPGQVPPQERERRAEALREIGRAKADAFRARHVGRTVRALVEGRSGEDGALRALTGNYLKVRVGAPAEAVGRLCDVRITRHGGGMLHGDIV